MKGGKVVKKKIIIKGILLLIVIALLSIGFTGCGVVISNTGTVYITVSNPAGFYDIYIDGIKQGTTDAHGNLTLTGVPMGDHTFEADGYNYYGYSYYGYWWYYQGTKTQTIYASTSNVTIPVELYY